MQHGYQPPEPRVLKQPGCGVLYFEDMGCRKNSNIQALLDQFDAMEVANQKTISYLMERITVVEKSNDLLIEELQLCIGLLKQFWDLLPDTEHWQGVMDHLESSLRAAEAVQEKKVFNLTGGIVGTR